MNGWSLGVVRDDYKDTALHVAARIINCENELNHACRSRVPRPPPHQPVPLPPQPPHQPQPPLPPPSSSKTERDDIIKYLPLYRALVSGELESVTDFLEKDPNAIFANISIKREKPIHIAVSHGHEELVEELLNRIDASRLGLIDEYGDTALHVAARGGNTRMAKALVDKTQIADFWVPSQNEDEYIPLTLAAIHGNEGTLELLRQIHTGAEDSNRRGLESLLFSIFSSADNAENVIKFTEFIKSENYDLALNVWERQHDCNAVHWYLKDNLNQLAKMVSAFSIENQLGYFRSWMHRCIDEQDDVQPVSTSHNMSDEENQLEDVQPVVRGTENPPEDSGSPHPSRFKDIIYSTMLHFVKGLISNNVTKAIGTKAGSTVKGLMSKFAKATGIEKEILKMKKKEIQARKLLNKMCSPIWTFDSGFVEVYFEAIKVAIKCGNVEFVEEVLRSNPTLLWGWGNKDKKSGTIFHIAVACRKEKIWNLIYGLTTEQRNKIAGILVDSNNLLHIAAHPLLDLLDEGAKKQGGEQELHMVFHKAPGAAMKVQRELQWYKEVERMVPSSYRFLANKNGETPPNLFSKSHSELIKEGERWMRETATSCTIVATLIVTVMFAAAFTLPGGTDDHSGNPKFLRHNSFMVFLISDALSLFSSVTAVLMFLSILTSRFEGKDFLKALPKRLIIGLATLFFSIAAMMVTFGVTLVIVFAERISWVVAPIMLFACVPVTSFFLLQFPLFLDIFSSTYGRSIFNKQTKCSFFNNPNNYIPDKML